MVVRRIGLTGGIGSGKSTVAGLLVAQGAVLVDTLFPYPTLFTDRKSVV